MATVDTAQLASARDAVSMLKFFELRDIEVSHHVGADGVCILAGTHCCPEDFVVNFFDAGIHDLFPSKQKIDAYASKDARFRPAPE